MKTEIEKPEAKVIGEDSNVFNLIGICRRALIRSGQKEKAEQMAKEVMASESYHHALKIMSKYCELV